MLKWKYFETNGPSYLDYITKGYTLPTITIGDVEIPKPENKWDENKMERDSLNIKAMNALVYALRSDEFNQACNCETAKQFWGILKVTHVGTNQGNE